MNKVQAIDWRIIYYILILILVIGVNAVLIHVIRHDVRVSNEHKINMQLLVKDIDGIESGVLRALDVGLRGYAVTGTTNMLDPYDYAFVFGDELLARIRDVGPSVGMESGDIDQLERLVNLYTEHMRSLKALLDQGRNEAFKEQLTLDYGVEIWDAYDLIRRKYHAEFLSSSGTMNNNLAILQQRILLTQGVSAALAVLLMFLIYRKVHSFSVQKHTYIQEIEEANAALDHHRANLEREVSWKTQDLEETNEMLQRTLEDIRTMQSYLLQSEKMTSLGTMTMGMAHEFNNALNQIKGGYHIFQKKILELTQEDKEELEACEGAITMYIEGVGRIERIVKAMQIFAEVGTTDFRDSDFNDLVDKALVILGPRLDDSVDLRRSLHQPLILRLQQANMLQVILQLLDNALYAVQASEERVIEITSEVVDDAVEISFINSGKGIPEDSLREIFDPFYTTKDPGVGTGLGLSVCYSIVLAHGGEIEAQNLEGGRVLFLLSLPFVEGSAKAASGFLAISDEQ